MRPGAIHESTFAVAETTFFFHVEAAKKLSHDAVIKSTGAARRSGVEWTIAPIAEWRETLAEIGIHVADNRVKAPNDVENLARRYPNGLLVIATVEVDPGIDAHKNPAPTQKRKTS